MAFWGIEVKPGKPYVHRFDEEKGRLHVSQATLGTFSSKKRTVVQCTVGDKTPIYICALSAEPKDTCLLNLEFEEEDDVTFSIIGTDSVHLSGYFYGESQDMCGHDHGSDDSGEDIMETESGSEESTDYDTEDSMDDFIDSDMAVFPPSPVPNSGVRIEEIIDDEKHVNGNDALKRPKKKKKELGRSGDIDNPQKQIVVKSGNSFPVMESEDEDGFPISSPGKKETIARNTEEESEIKEKKVDGEETRKEGKDNDASTKSVKRKIHAIVGDGDNLRETGKPDDSSAVSANCEINDKRKRKNKKKKIKDKENKAQESGKGTNVGALADEAITTHVDQALAVEKKSDPLTSKRQKKQKKKIKKEETTVDGNAMQTLSDKNLSNAKTEENAEAKPLQERSFANGLVIQEIGMGKPDGRKASPGKKVSVHYIGKLKNGKIFDSNIGRAPFKFRLGIGQVIKGWDVGVTGMRVGDKRKLTIPPSMGYGSKGAGGDIPPNSWLVFDVELVDVS